MKYTSSAQSWIPMGPFSRPALANEKDHALKNAVGIGRVTCVRMFSLHGQKVIFLGSPYGGLFRTSNDTAGWVEESTGSVPPGVSDFFIHPKDSSRRFIVTGDPDCILDPNGPALGSESCQSGGIFNSTDAGKTWSAKPIGTWYDTTGKALPDFWKYPSLKVIRKLLVHPSRPSTMFCVLHTYNYTARRFDGYVYRSVDGGNTWHVSLFAAGDKLKDLEFNPSRPGLLYAGGRAVYRSANGGKKWSALKANGLPPDSLLARCEISVANTHPEMVFVLAVYPDRKQNEIYISNNSGKAFYPAGKGQGSPEWRSAIAADPTNINRLYLTCGNKLCVFTGEEKKYRLKSTISGIHDDIHDLFVDSDSKVYASTDGGLYVSSDSGMSFIDRSNGLNVAECWSVAVNHSGTEKVLSGLQDCGTILYDSAAMPLHSWVIVRGGDGMDAAFDPGNSKLCYGSDGNNNIFSRSEDGGYSWSGRFTLNEPFAYFHPFALNPQNPSSVFVPFHYLYKSENGGESFRKLPIGDLPSNSEAVCALSVAPSDSNYLYMAYTNPSWNENPLQKIYVSSNSGNNWRDISPGLEGVKYQGISALAVHPVHPEKIVAGFRGGGSIKVMISENGGADRSWKNMSDGLPPEADIKALLFDETTAVLFAATHRGVWQLGRGINTWTRTGAGLPLMMISDIDFNPLTKTLYAGTHGRGIWKLTLD